MIALCVVIFSNVAANCAINNRLVRESTVRARRAGTLIKQPSDGDGDGDGDGVVAMVWWQWG